MSELCARLPWDTEHFGMPIGRVRGTQLNPATSREAVAWADRHGIRCLYLLAEAGDTGTVQAAEHEGFRLVDVRLTLGRGTDRRDPPASAIRPTRQDDLGALEPVAAAAHTDSRFFADRRFDRAAVARMYQHWLRASISGELADLSFVAEADSRPSGYITGRADSANASVSIGLLAVAEEARGRGLGPKLISAVVAEAAERGAARVTVVTQGRNLLAQRLYQAAGFRSARMDLWLHRWSDEDAQPVANAQ